MYFQINVFLRKITGNFMLGTAIIRCEYTPEVSNLLSMFSISYIFHENCVGAFFGHAYVKAREHVLLQNKITDRNVS